MLRFWMLWGLLMLPGVGRAAEILDFTALTDGYVPHSAGQLLLLEDLQLFPDLLKPEDWADLEFTLAPYQGASTSPRLDRYGNPVVRLDLVKYGWLQQGLVKRGAAVLSGYRPYPQADYDQLKATERRARLQGRGIWAAPQRVLLAATEIEGERVPPGFYMVEGRVLSAKATSKGSYLNFGENWKKDFSVLISSRNRGSFRKTGWKEADIVNKWVRVRGFLRFYNGPFMEIQFPEQLEILNEN